MPINRAPFNALVDDNGSGLTGSIWNKAAISGVLLDPIDALVGPWIAFTPVWFADVGSPTTGTNYGSHYCLIGKTLLLSLSTTVNIPSTTVNLYLTVPGGWSIAQRSSAAMPIGGAINATGVAQGIAGAGSPIYLTRDLSGATSWAPGTYLLALTLPLVIS